MNRRSYYDILGIPKGATLEQVKAAYRARARDCHPDLAPGDPAKAEAFKAAAEAYRVLSDPSLRARYDRDGAMPEGTAYGAPHRVVSSSLAAVARGVARAARRAVVVPGTSIRQTVTLSFVDAALGTTVVLDVMRREDDTSPPTSRSRSFPIPAGVRDGQLLRWQGEGNDGDPGARRGDVILELVVEPDGWRTREGNDIIEPVALPLSALIDGATVDANTIHGRVSVSLPPNVGVGQRFRVESKGVLPDGAHVLVVTLAVPTALSEKQRAALAAFEALLEDPE